jgi:hypothetical protein
MNLLKHVCKFVEIGFQKRVLCMWGWVRGVGGEWLIDKDENMDVVQLLQ